MSIHEIGEQKNPRVRLRLNSKDPFPEKLYDVATDGYLIQWNGCGTGVQVEDPDLFEKLVMKCYPGFLQIPSFVNFRRLFREYSFDWKYHEGDIFEFSHPCFVYGYRDSLSEVRTRKKSFSKPSMELSTFHRDVLALDSDGIDDGTKRYRTRRSRLTKKQPETPDSYCQESSSYTNDSSFVINDSFQDGNSNDSFKQKTLNLEQNGEAVRTFPQCDTQYGRSTFSSVASQIMKLFIKNEFTFEDFCAWAERNQVDFGLDADQWDIFSSMNKYGYSDVPVSEPMNYTPRDHSVEQTPFLSSQEIPGTPCGNCRCCMAYQNFYFSQNNVSEPKRSRSKMLIPSEFEMSCDNVDDENRIRPYVLSP